LTEEAAITAIQNGQADWMFDPPPPDRLVELGTKFADRVFLHPLTAMWYAPMNTNLAPFDDVRVRQAVNFAIDRGALVKALRRPEPRPAGLPDPATGLPLARALLPLHGQSRRDLVGARHGKGQGARG
jgi:ABC-type transport system substrate-binding protein